MRTWERIAGALVVPVVLLAGAPGGSAAADEKAAGTRAPAQAAQAARGERGLDWLTKNQAPDGSWGGTYSISIASFAALAYLAAEDEAFAGPRAPALQRALGFLLAQQKDGTFPKQGHTWIHGQGFATLALGEAYGRSLTCKTKPDLDMRAVRRAVSKAVRVIEASQSTSGGWWYVQDAPHLHEGSTTCCAVQALVSADNFGLRTDSEVLARGFEYLRRCQNADGGFDYKLGDAQSMLEGTAGGVATLGLMRKFDYQVMMKGYEFLLNRTPQAITKARFPYYGHFYGLMGLRLLGQEFEPFRPRIDAYARAALKDLGAWQREDGSWPVHGWIAQHRQPDAYATAFASLIFSMGGGRLSIFNRDKPLLPAPPRADPAERGGRPGSG